LAPPRKDAPAAASAQYERLFADVERALAGLDFFRTRNAELIMRTIRSVAYRSAPDAREIELLRAMALETLRALERLRANP
jgi:tRNA C32,U32 (ribose-2'-O)-methylase TrmJ